VAEYRGYPNRNAYRNARARARGYESYWHERQTMAVIRESGMRDGQTREGAVRSRFIAESKRNPTARFRRIFRDGYVTLVRTAKMNGITDLMGDVLVDVFVVDPPTDVSASLFWYH
jgi:hypothetical protein